MHTRKFIGAAVFGFLASATAQAALVDSSGSWGSVTPVGFSNNLSGVGTSVLSWGVPSSEGGEPSSYEFIGVENLMVMLPGVGESATFQLGTFIHNNNPIDPPFITGATLDISFSIEEGATFSDTISFGFTHTETDNQEPCDPSGATVCPDIVSISEGQSETFVLNSIEWLLELAFEGGELTFNTEEGKENTRILEGTLTGLRQVVPEPLSVALVGAGLLGFGLRRRARR